MSFTGLDLINWWSRLLVLTFNVNQLRGMKRSVMIILSLTGLVLCRCSTQRVLELDGLRPADISISPQVRSVVLMTNHQVNYPSRSSLTSPDQLTEFISDSIIARTVMDGCMDAMSQSPRFEICNPILKRDSSPGTVNPSRVLSRDQVRSIAGDPPRDAILSLERALVWDTMKWSRKEGKVNYYIYILVIRTFWQFYEVKDFRSSRYYFVDTVSFNDCIPYEFSLKNGPRGYCVRSALYESGVRSAERFAPLWEMLSREYFTAGPWRFRKGVKRLVNAQWSQAAEFMRPFTESKDTLLAGRSCFNMAVACEMANNFEAAEAWLKQSERLELDTNYINRYRAILLKRKLEVEKLAGQMR